MSSSKKASNEQQALLDPQSSPPPYSELPSTSASTAPPSEAAAFPTSPFGAARGPGAAPPRSHAHALGPTPVASLPPPPPALWHSHSGYNGYGRRPHARADARARRRFCGAFCCALIVWLVAAAVFGAILGEELVRRNGDGDWYAVRSRRQARMRADHGGLAEVPSQHEGVVEFAQAIDGANETRSPPSGYAVI